VCLTNERSARPGVARDGGADGVVVEGHSRAR
jgi:hypothetical protein